MREILDVKFFEDVAQDLAQSFRELGRTNVQVHHEKVYAESVWRLGWVIVADAQAPEDERPLAKRRRRS